MTNNRILITGANGAIGKFITKSVMNNDDFISISTDITGKVDKQGDLCDYSFTNSLFKENDISHIIHCASLWNGLNNDYNIAYKNSLMTMNLIKSIRKVKQFVYISSSAVYENLDGLENDCCSGFNSSYGISKIFSEKLIFLGANDKGYNYTILRPFHVVSPEEKYKEGSSHACTNLYREIIELKKENQNYASFEKIGFTWVEDIVDVIIKCISNRKAYNEIFNVGTSEEHTIKDLFNEIKKIANKLNLTHFTDKKKHHSKRKSNKKISSRFKKAYNIFGWKATTEFSTCIEKFICYKHKA